MGVKIAHKNLMCSLYNCIYYSINNFYVKISKTDRILSYLPMSHVIEISAQAVIIHCGGSIGFYSGEMDNFLKDIEQVRPTVFVSVPRFFNMIYREISSAISMKGSISSSLFKKVYVHALKSEGKEAGPMRRLMENIAFKKVRNILGGKIKLFISGSSSIDNDVRKFFSVCFSCPFIETYGLTESCGAITMVGA